MCCWLKLILPLRIGLVEYIKELNSDQIRVHVQQSHELWGGGRSIENRHKKIVSDIFSQSGNFIMSGLFGPNKEMLASLKRYYFTLLIAGQRSSCLGLGAIYTNEKFRNQGVATCLIKKVIEESRTDLGVQCVLLYSDINPNFYKKLGFIPLEARYGVLREDDIPNSKQIDGDNTLTHQSELKLKLTSDNDLTELIRLYDLCTEAANIKTLRTNKVWALFHGLNGFDSSYLILDPNAKAVGYFTAAIDQDKKSLFLAEFLALPDFARAAWAAVVDFACNNKITEIKGWVSSTSLVPYKTFHDRERAIPMLRILDSAKSTLVTTQSKSYFAASDHF